MAKTENLKLNIISRDDNLLIADFFQQISGVENGSNMLVIDDAILQLEGNLDKLMAGDDYDPDGSIKDAGGFAAWVMANYEIAEEMSY